LLKSTWANRPYLYYSALYAPAYAILLIDIRVKVGYARFVQIPIHRVSKQENLYLADVFISKKKNPNSVLKIEHNLTAIEWLLT